MHPLVTICEGKAAMKTIQTAAHRYHDICMGHRVVGHEGKCRHLHGHNYRIHFYCESAGSVNHQPVCSHMWQRNAMNLSRVCVKCNLEVDENTFEPIVKETQQHTQLDSIGRVIDFGVMKEKLCQWLEDNWDHKFMHWDHDLIMCGLQNIAKEQPFNWGDTDYTNLLDSLINVPFNPTAENIAHHLLTVVAPQQLAGTGVVCTKIVIEETAKCAVTVTL